MKNKVCCFAGHRDVYNAENVLAELKNKIEELIIKENITEFWVGNYGWFYGLAAMCVRILKTKYKGIKLVLVISEYYQAVK